MGSEDIRKQLPAESLLFDGVNSAWVTIMKDMHRNPNAVTATQKPGILKTLTDTNDKLERIQKSLDQCVRLLLLLLLFWRCLLFRRCLLGAVCLTLLLRRVFLFF